jgi:hypothetical protein
VKGRDNLGGLDIHGNVISVRMGLGEIAWEDADLIHLAQDRDLWLALVNTVMNLRIPKRAENFSTF